MNMYIICILATIFFLIGGMISYFVFKSKKKEESSTENLDIKNKYEKRLKDANLECDKLRKQLGDALNGKLEDSIKDQLQEVDVLKKKIRNLEDEIEENEDDISDLRKKIKAKDLNISELQGITDKKTRDLKLLTEELTLLKRDFEYKVEELTLKDGSLDFIQEILSAKEIYTEDVKALYKKIDYFESFVKDVYLNVNEGLFEKYDFSWNGSEGKEGLNSKKNYFINSFDQWASTKRKSWLDGKITIAFVGEFSAGKTSIVNRILSQDDPTIPKLPVSAKATTAIPTYIAGGEAVSYSFISGDDKRKMIKEETFKKVSKDILDQVKGVSSLIKYFVMTYKNPNLDGLSILDTPGFNSNDKEDKDRTIDVINECDALFWVFDINAGTVNRSSIEILKEKLNKPLYVVINKVDTKADSEVKKVEELISQTLVDAGLVVEKFIRFSSKTPLENIMNPIKNVSKITTRDTFVLDVKNDIEDSLVKIQTIIKSYSEIYNEFSKEGDSILSKISNKINRLKIDCDTASDIPRWVEHWFRKDRFEMTSEEGNRLMNMLNKIANEHAEDLKRLFQKSLDKNTKIDQAWSELSNCKIMYHKVNDCYEQYKKVSKDI